MDWGKIFGRLLMLLVFGLLALFGFKVYKKLEERAKQEAQNS